MEIVARKRSRRSRGELQSLKNKYDKWLKNNPKKKGETDRENGNNGADGKNGNRGKNVNSSFSSILDDPNVPDNFKKTVREMQKRQVEFKRKHGNK